MKRIVVVCDNCGESISKLAPVIIYRPIMRYDERHQIGASKECRDSDFCNTECLAKWLERGGRKK